MIHPHTEVKFISEKIGYGVFATDFIPKGAITYVIDPLDVIITRKKLETMDISIQNIIEKYSYINEKGHYIVSWDAAKYVNHCCNPNTISTGWGFEIALRDINKGDEITDEYGIFNLTEEFTVGCSCTNTSCRKMIKGIDFDVYYGQWDGLIKDALSNLNEISQPLLPLLDEKNKLSLLNYLQTGKRYKSVIKLRYKRS